MSVVKLHFRERLFLYLLFALTSWTQTKLEAFLHQIHHLIKVEIKDFHSYSEFLIQDILYCNFPYCF